MTSPTVFLDERYMLHPAYETRNYDLATDSRTMDFPLNGILIDGVAMTATAAELNAIAGNGLSAAELAVLDGVTPGIGLASKAVILDSGDDFIWPATGILTCSLVTANADPFILTGLAGSTSAGGALTFVGGAGDGVGNDGGAFTFTTGAGVNGTTGTADSPGNMTFTMGVAGTATTGVGGDGGAMAFNGVVGGAASATAGVGGAGTSIAWTTGAGGTATDTTGGASGDASITTGAGGATSAAAGVAGAAGSIDLTAGPGGADVEAGSGTGGDGGAVVLQAGVGGAGNTPGLGGQVHLRSAVDTPVLSKKAVAGTGIDTEVLTTAELFNGVFLQNPTGATTCTTPTGAQISGGLGPDLAVGDSFMFTLINTGATTEVITFTAGASGMTVTGSATVDPLADVATLGHSSGTFLFVNTAADTWIAYRM